MRLFYQQLITAAGTRLELRQVSDRALPPDLKDTATLSQHLLISPAKARQMLGWHDTASPLTLQQAVRWHLSHPPTDPDFTADDIALTASRP